MLSAAVMISTLRFNKKTFNAFLKDIICKNKYKKKKIKLYKKYFFMFLQLSQSHRTRNADVWKCLGSY